MAHPQDKAVRSLLHRLSKTHELIWAHDGEELTKLFMKVSEAKSEALDVITSVDESHLRVKNKETQKCSTLFIVLGNENYELVCDWTIGDDSLDEVITEHSVYWENK
jgi:hypothetical protein